MKKARLVYQTRRRATLLRESIVETDAALQVQFLVTSILPCLRLLEFGEFDVERVWGHDLAVNPESARPRLVDEYRFASPRALLPLFKFARDRNRYLRTKGGASLLPSDRSKSGDTAIGATA